MRSEGNARKVENRQLVSPVLVQFLLCSPVLVMDFLAKSSLTLLEHTPYSTDLAPADCYVFPVLKSALY